MMTTWGENLDPNNVLQEYPRPQLVRDSYLNLNGTWDYAFTAATQSSAPAQWEGPILVPFSPEAPLSGVNRALQPDEVLWYRRTFSLPGGFQQDRVLLHFGAVDQDCRVWVNGTQVGGHQGGYLPFTLDITDTLTSGDNELIVRVRDVTDQSWRSRGKQSLKPGGIWYTAQSGIWQTVWLESVPSTWIDQLVLTPDLEAGAVDITIRTATASAETAEVVIVAEATEVARAQIQANTPTRISLGSEVRLWSPENPFLYDVHVTLGADQVTSYVGMRSFGMKRDANGRTRLLLNGEPYLHAGLLDQGYWPDGLYTAPSDEALIFDIQTAKDLGFTMLRKHIKIEPLRWYHHCDRLGMLVWQDMVNGGRTYNPAIITTPVFTGLRLDDSRHRLFGRQDTAGREEFLQELDDTIELLRSVPSIAVWVPFNEGWGQFDARETADRVRELDPSRLIDHASGWHDQFAGDMVSRHIYFRRYRLSEADAHDPRAAVLSEYGGYSYRVPGHVWTNKEFGYRKFNEQTAYELAYLDLQNTEIGPAIDDGLAAFVHTQLSDVEQETNGLITYDRKVIKVDTDKVLASNKRLQDRLARAVGENVAAFQVEEREITEPIPLTRPDGRLNPHAVGWTRNTLINTDHIGKGKVGRGRNKRWEYWAVTTPKHIIALVASDIDYAGVNEIWVFDRSTGEEIGYNAISPLGKGVSLPGTLEAGPSRVKVGKISISIDEEPAGTRLRATGPRLDIDILAELPAGHERLGVVVPWTDRLFQYTVKDVARPATGTVKIDEVIHEIPAGDSWATLDHGRGRWPHRVHWNWGAGSGHSNGHVVGVQVGGKWTNGTGSVENSLLIDGRLHKISEELVWDYDTNNWLDTWRVSGARVDLTFTPFHVKESQMDLKVLSTSGHQCFGHWNGTMTDDSGTPVQIINVLGWAEDVRQQW